MTQTRQDFDKSGLEEEALKAAMAKSLSLPFNQELVEKLSQIYPTPFYIYDERAIKVNAARLNDLFSWNRGFKEYFAVKALPNPHVLGILREVGFGVDCSSLAELVLAERSGFRGEQIMFTSNDTPEEEFVKAAELGAIINFDDIEHLSYVERVFEARGLKFPELVSFRFNPGHERKGNVIIGDPAEAKFGCTREQLSRAYRMARDRGVKRFGLHSMVASNERDPGYFVETVDALLALTSQLSEELGISFEFINMGGGIGIPYSPLEQSVDLGAVSRGIAKTFEAYIGQKSPDENNSAAYPRLYMECGRVITGPYGYLVTRVLHEKRIYKHYLGVDACMANLMRPGMYGAYHHITVLGKEDVTPSVEYDVVGSLCENNDKFAVDRMLPNIEPGDLLVIHDAGAHAHSMGFNYNGKLRSAELLLRTDGSVICIRRAETLDDYFATVAGMGLA